MNSPRVPDLSRLTGVVTTAELAAAGISRRQLERLVDKGALLRLTRGGFASATTASVQARDPAAMHALVASALLAVTSPGAVVSHRSAAMLHGLDLLDRRPNTAVALTRSPQSTSNRTGRSGIELHVAALPAGHVVTCRGIPVTSVTRTVIDLARTLSFVAGVVVADSALRTEKTTKAELQAVIMACPRWRGLRAARQVVAFADARSESVLESISRVAFHNLGLPPPDLQVWVGHAGELIGRTDFLWRAHRTIAEADGAIKYQDPSRAIAQLERDRQLREAGYEVVHFTWRDITRTPDQVTASINAAFRRASALATIR